METFSGTNIQLPIFDVPNICTTKRAIIITTVIGTTHFSSDVDTTLKPSTADRTLIAGVRAPSPEEKQTDRFLDLHQTISPYRSITKPQE